MTAQGGQEQEAAHQVAGDLALAREALRRIRDACDLGIREIEEGKIPAPLAASGAEEIDKEARGVQVALVVARSMVAVFGQGFRDKVRAVMVVRLGGQFRGGGA